MSRKSTDAKPSTRKQSTKSVSARAEGTVRKKVAPDSGSHVAPDALPGSTARKRNAKIHDSAQTPGENSTTRDVQTTQRQRASKTARILAIDIGGTGLKAAMLDVGGKMTSERQRIDTPYPCSPERMIEALLELCEPIGAFDFLSIGFPGVVRDGRVITAPHFDQVDPDDPFAAGIMAHADKEKDKDADDASAHGDATDATDDATGAHGAPTGDTAWRGFALGQAVAKALAKQGKTPVRPVQVINDAEMQGLAVIRGKGLEFVLTLGTGAGSALFRDGVLMPHLELAHHPIRGRKSYNDYVGEVARKKIGKKRWNRHVQRTIAILDSLLHFDHLYIGGGNAQRIAFPLPKQVTIVSNDAGIEGGAALWRDVAV